LSPLQSGIRNEGKQSALDLFSPDSSPFGVTFTEWTVRWWRWYLSQPKSASPSNDQALTNADPSRGQIFPEVWFLAGTTGGFAERNTVVPRGRAILCPIINFEISRAEDPSLVTDDDLVSFARKDVDQILPLELTVDDIPFSVPFLSKFRISSGPFDVTLPEGNIWGVKAGPTRAAADGYWLFLKPLSAGVHMMQFGGSCLAGTINIGAKYHLSIE
jgi:hypothetical protein